MFWLFQVVVFAGPAWAINFCSWSEVSAQCGEFQKAKSSYTSPPLSGEAGRSSLLPIFEKIRKSYEDEILAGRSIDQLSPEEKSIYARVKFLRLLNPETNDYSCTSRGPLSGRFLSDRNGVVICPGPQNLPEQAYYQVMAHEISHALDPCNCRHDFISLDASLLEGKRVYEKYRPFIKSEIDDWKDDPEQHRRVISGLPRTMERWLRKYDLDLLREMRGNGILRTVGSGFPPERNPFQPAMDCMEKDLGPLSESRESIQGRMSGASDAEKERLKWAAAFPHCVNGIGIKPSKLTESFADLNGAKLAGRLLVKNPTKNNSEKWASLWAFLEPACAQKKSSDSYLSHQDRFEKLVMSDPNMRAAYNCPGPPPLGCGRLLPAFGVGKSRAVDAAGEDSAPKNNQGAN